MKKYQTAQYLSIAIAAAFIIFFSNPSHATQLFMEDFEGGDLSAWTGRDSALGVHSGQIVVDPLDPANSALNFTQITSGGDIFTIDSFSSDVGEFQLSFDYLGYPNPGGANSDLGGFVGYSYGFPDEHTWLGGTTDFGGKYNDIIPDTGQWEHVEITFTAGDNIHIMLEDFKKPFDTAMAGDVYFDNIGLNPIPEPATLFLLGSGLVGMAVAARRRYL